MRLDGKQEAGWRSPRVAVIPSSGQTGFQAGSRVFAPECDGSEP